MDISISLSPLEPFLDTEFQNGLTVKLKEIRSDSPQRLDVLVLGTSRMHNGFATEKFEQLAGGKVNAYNMGLPNSDYFTDYIALKEHIRNYGKPKLLLIEMCDFTARAQTFNDIDTMYLRTYLLHNPGLAVDILANPILSLRYKQETVLTFLSAIYRYHSILAPNYLAFILRRGPLKPNQFKQGWQAMPFGRVMKSPEAALGSAKETIAKLLDHYAPIDDSKLRFLLAYTQHEAIPVVLVMMPNHPDYQRLFEASSFYAPYQAKMQRVIRDFHAPVIDLTSVPINQADRYYFDARHLDGAGALLYTQKPFQHLHQICNQKDAGCMGLL